MGAHGCQPRTTADVVRLLPKQHHYMVNHLVTPSSASNLDAITVRAASPECIRRLHPYRGHLAC